MAGTRSFIPALRREGWDGIQSRWVLPTARKVYLIGAIIAVGVSMLGLLVALGFQGLSFRGPTREAVPQVAAVVPAPIALDTLAARFAGPSNLRLDPDYVEFPLTAATVVGRLSADSSSAATLRFEIIGGPDAELFSIDNGGTPRLLVSRVLAAQLNPLPLTTPRRPYVVRVLATDGGGNQSAPANITVNLQFGPAPKFPAAAEPAFEPATEVVSGSAALAKIAPVLASLTAKRGTPDFIDAYKYALDEPKRCDADGNDAFSQQYVRGFDHVRARLTPGNVATFYAGICSGWRASIQAADATMARSLAEQNAAVARNAAHEQQAFIASAGARAIRNVALGFAAAALVVFMMVALFLAFLALEGHSAAMREAIEILSRRDAPGS